MKMNKWLTALVLALVLCMAMPVAMAATLPTGGAVSTGTYTLDGDVALSSTLLIEKGSSVVLDLAGHELSYTVSTDATSNLALIRNNGNLTIKDSSGGNGKVVFKYTGATVGDPSMGSGKAMDVIANEQGTLVIEGGQFINETPSGRGYSYVVDNMTNNNLGDSVVTIKGGVFKTNYSIAVRGFANSAINLNKITIDGGDFNGGIQIQQPSPNNTGRADRAELTINDGTITASKYAVYVYGYKNPSDIKVRLNGGEITGGTAAVFVAAVAHDPANDFIDVEITGGDYNGNVWSYEYVNGNGSLVGDVVSGGSFDTDVTDLLKDGVEVLVKDGVQYVGESIPKPVVSSNYPPRTGDNTNIAMLVSLMALSAAAFVVLNKKARFN